MLSLALGVTPVKPHGYWPISSEWASTESVTVRPAPGLLSLSPNSAARRPSGTKSVRPPSTPAAPATPERPAPPRRGADAVPPAPPPRRVRQVVARAPPAAREPRRRADPLTVD